jgi:hypothetical protein
MKKGLSGILVILMISVFSSCDRRISAYAVPDHVESAFNNMYPGATSVKWQRSGNNKYEAKFKAGDKHHYEAKFRDNGTFIKEN